MAKLCLYLLSAWFPALDAGGDDPSYGRVPDEPSCSADDALAVSPLGLYQPRPTKCQIPLLGSLRLPSLTPGNYGINACCGFRFGSAPSASFRRRLHRHYDLATQKEPVTSDEDMKVSGAIQKHFARLALQRRDKKRKTKPRGSRKQLLPESKTELGTGSRVGVDDKAHKYAQAHGHPDKSEESEKEGRKKKSNVNNVNGDADRGRSSNFAQCENCRRRELEEQRLAAASESNGHSTLANGDSHATTHPEVIDGSKTEMLSPARAQDTEPNSSQDAPTADEPLEVRNASGQTARSDASNDTVHHDPSKRCAGDGESRFQELDIDPFTDRNAITRLSGLSSGEYPPMNDCQTRRHGCGNSRSNGAIEKPSSSGPFAERSSDSSELQMVSRKSSRASSAVSRRILSSSDPERRERKRSKALISFNASAEVLGLDTLTSVEEARGRDTGISETQDADESANGDSLFHRLRNAKSNITMKRKKSVKHGLRRMKTMTNMRIDFPLGSLKGKSLEEIARLGGQSIINMPNAYSPGPLCLPTCIAAPALYLKDYGPAAQYLYVRPGNQAVICSLYSHYSRHVFGAMRARYPITKTTRSPELPDNILNLEGSSRTKEEGLYDVAAFFRLLLSELPEGILGTPYLFRVLKQIHDHDFAPELVFQDPGRKEYVWETPPSTGTRVRMISLALVSLATDMQLELICAVFGLLSLTHEESSLRELFHTEHIHFGERSCRHCRGYPKIDVLASAFAPLLYGTRGLSDSDILGERVQLGNRHGRDVVAMLVSLWRLVVLQLRQWEVISTGR